MISKYTLTIGTVYNNGKACLNPIIEVVGSGDFTTACIDKKNGVYELEGILPENKCLDIIVSCGECHDCPPKEIRKCICSDDAECEDCETCNDSGFCESTCPPDEYCYGERCVECDPSTPCPNGQTCKSGRCVCPQNKPFNVNGVCLECIHTGVVNCNECKDGVLTPLPCSGVCDPSSNDCVDCLQSSDCDGDNECCVGKLCDCCEGFVRASNGSCVPAPDCDEETPCGPCKTCRDGKCEDIVCPDGKICVDGSGCVEECDCTEAAPCTKITSRCVTSTQGCGCIACEGDCTSGCSEGCYCDGTKCVGDICYGGKCPCTNGADCPEGYGCDGSGNCVPCSSLDCDNSECASVLGCGCANDKCIDSDISCGNTPCTTSDDCGFGCTCDEGVCKSCENYSCSECGALTGCGCTGGDCEGEETICTDIFELDKSDTACTLTATLAKTESCACSPITVDVQGKRITTGSANYTTIEFIAEVRKGVYEGSLSLPLLDNLANPEIVENDSPTSGRVSISGKQYYRQYTIDPITQIRTRIEDASEATSQNDSNFITGTVSKLSLGNLSFPKMNVRIPTGFDPEFGENSPPTKEIEYYLITLEAKVTDNFDFPNECTYDDGVLIGKYTFRGDEDFLAFGFGFTNHIAKTLTSPESRLPIFRWYKSASDVITGAPFRKRYIPLTGTDHVDTITKADGLDACKYYKVISDCTCSTSPDIYAVFCNPEDLAYTVTGCNKQINISNELLIPCDVNQDVEFYFRAGSVYKTWIGSRWDIIAGESYTSTSTITSVEFGQVCDSDAMCKKVYEVPFVLDNLRLSITPTCNPNGLTGTFTVPSTDIDAKCSVESLTVDGVMYIPGNTVTVNSGVTNYTVDWACGCDDQDGVIDFVCCENLSQTITRFCDGSVQCSPIDGVSYSVYGTNIPDLCSYISGLSRASNAVITAQRTGCNPFTISIPAIAITCCDEFNFIIATIVGGIVVIIVYGEEDAVINLTRLDGMTLTNNESITASGTNRSFINRDTSVGYRLTLVSSLGCDSRFIVLDSIDIKDGEGTPNGPAATDDTPPTSAADTSSSLGVVSNSTYVQSPPLATSCGQETELYRYKSGSAYTLRGEVAPQNCPCGSVSASFDVTNVNDNVAQDALDISYEVITNTAIAPLSTGNVISILDVNRGVSYSVSPNEVDIITIPKSITTQAVPENVSIFYRNRRNSTSNPERQVCGFFLSTANLNYDTTNIQSSSLTLTTNTGLTGTFVGTILADRIEYMPNCAGSGVTGFLLGEGSNVTVAASITVTSTEGQVQTIDKSLEIESKAYGYNISFDFNSVLNRYTQTENDVLLKLVVGNLGLLNNCGYSGSTPSISMNSAGVVGASTATAALNVGSNPAYTEFVWKEDGVVAFTNYSNTLSQFPIADADLGSDYLLTTTCGSCTENQALRLCKPISGSVVVAGALDSVTFNMNIDSATSYDATFEGVTINIPAQSTVSGQEAVSVTFAGVVTASTAYTVDFADVAVANCVATLNFTTQA
jgi:hypothetical protein